MPSSEKWKVTYTESFKKSFQKILKEHYRKKEKDKKKLERIFNQILCSFQSSCFPRSNLWKAKPEPSPKKSLKNCQRLAKVYFNLPGLRGASKEGRLLYLIDKEKKEIKLLYCYTHEEFAKRPPDGFIKKLIKRQ